jgi:hypothetical protein
MSKTTTLKRKKKKKKKKESVSPPQADPPTVREVDIDDIERAAAEDASADECTLRDARAHATNDSALPLIPIEQESQTDSRTNLLPLNTSLVSEIVPETSEADTPPSGRGPARIGPRKKLLKKGLRKTMKKPSASNMSPDAAAEP